MSNLGDAADVNPANSKSQNSFLFPVHAVFRHDCPLAVKPASTPRRLVHTKTWRESLPIDMLLSAVSVLLLVQPSSEIPAGLMYYPVLWFLYMVSVKNGVIKAAGGTLRSSVKKITKISE